MAKIIDFDFYRKFRVILPVRSPLAEDTGRKLVGTAKTQARRYYRRRRKALPEAPTNHSGKK